MTSHSSSKRKHQVADHLFFKLQYLALAIQETAHVCAVAKEYGDKDWTLEKDEGEAEVMWTGRENGACIGIACTGEGVGRRTFGKTLRFNDVSGRRLRAQCPSITILSDEFNNDAQVHQLKNFCSRLKYR